MSGFIEAILMNSLVKWFLSTRIGSTIQRKLIQWFRKEVDVLEIKSLEENVVINTPVDIKKISDKKKVARASIRKKQRINKHDKNKKK